MKTCYLCGAPNPTTKDHVPPRGFFPEPRPADLITLPCCQDCNSSFSLDDEAVRVWFSMGIGHSDAAEWIIQNKVFPGTLSRSSAFLSEILKSMEDAIITDEDGQPMEVVKYSMDRERAERFVIRVAKGLLRHYFPDYDASADRWSAIFMGLQRDHLALIEPLRDKLPYFDGRGDGVISYRFGFTPEETTGIWIIGFFGTSLFVVTHSHADRKLPHE